MKPNNQDTVTTKGLVKPADLRVSDARKIGRRLRLKFRSSSIYLDRIEFKFNTEFALSYFDRNGVEGHVLRWHDLEAALSLCFLGYVEWLMSKKSGRYFFGAMTEDASMARQLSGAINQNRHAIHALFLGDNPKSKSDDTCVTHLIFPAIPGMNKSGKNKDKPAMLTIDERFLPPDCIEVYWDQDGSGISGQLTDVGDIQVLAKRIRNDSRNHYEMHDAPVVGREQSFSEQLLENISKLQTTEEIRKCMLSVLSHPQYPLMMARSKDLVPNPVWNMVSQSEREELRSFQKLDGPSPPNILHLDLLLIRRNNRRGRGELYTYFSKKGWETYLIHFRPWLIDDDRASRSELNAKKVAKYCEGLTASVSVKPLPGKFLISVKKNKDYGGLTIYLFEFCSVEFRTKPVFTTETINVNGKKVPRDEWFDLDAMRLDESVMAGSADVVRALHEFFGVSLGPIPVSFHDPPAAKKHKKKRRR
jgi:hypothetical protein